MIKQLPISLSGAGKRDVRTQFAALCYRVQKGKIRVLMITSRGSKRWIVPKGWPMDGLTPAGSAVQEAWEEAGVRGTSDGRCLGIFSYSKDAEDLGALPCLAMVYAVEVETLADDYPEAGQRERAWMSRKKAARLVDEPELARILRDFDPRASAGSP
ncbi:NUDIX hydrolase [uncultured Roseobacter sp.]|uniref:NUDIX hydrolase n=1 Tax=uncultured Roseobacter sp. TaxID=114847 RepID=UPI0026074A2B|nr:NUDIX hydrolase [uncultured Roseobacter sp.]